MAAQLEMIESRPQEALFKPALVLMAGRFLGFVAAFAIPIVLVRLFDQTQFGTYKQIFLIFSTLFGVAQVGMAESLYYFLPQNAQRGGPYIFNTLLVLAVVGAASIGILYGWREQVAALMNNPALGAFLPYLGFYLLFMLMAVVLEIVMTVRKQHFGAASAYAATDLARAVLYVAPVLLLADLHALMLGAIAFAFVRFTATVVYVKSQYGSELRPDRAALRAHLGYAVPFGLAALIEVVQMNLHLYAVSYYFGAATFAIYAVGCLQIPLSDFLMTSTCNVMMVNMRERVLANDAEEVVAIWLDSVRKLTLIFFPLVAFLLVVARPLIVLLFTADYQRSVPVFMVWTLSMLLMSLLTDGVLRVFAQTRFLMLQNMVRLGVVLATIQWFLAQFGLVGAVLVTLLATVVSKAMALGRIRSLLGVPLRRLLPWKSLANALLIAGLAAIPAIAIRIWMQGPELAKLTACGLVYCAAYYLLLMRFGPMQPDEKRMLSQWLQVPFFKISRTWKS